MDCKRDKRARGVDAWIRGVDAWIDYNSPKTLFFV